MRWTRKAWWLALTATLQVVTPSGAFADDPAVMARPNVKPPMAVRDVQLDAAGTLHGQVVTPEGAPLAGTRIVLGQFNKPVGESSTDKDGNFALTGVRGGTYELRSAEASAWVRVWTADSAPPAATKGALLVSKRDTVRGNINYLSTQMMQPPEAVGALMIPAAIAGGVIALKQHHETDSGS